MRFISKLMNDAIGIRLFYSTLAIGIFGIVVTIIVYATNNHVLLGRDIDPTTIGTFGDFIGGFFGTILTIAATFLIWLTYNSQKEELAKTNELANKQLENLVVQQFENTFFNMVSSLNNIPDTIQGDLPKIVSDVSGNPQLEVRLKKNEYTLVLHKGREFFIIPHGVRICAKD